MEVEDKKRKRISIFLIRYPIYKSKKIPRQAPLVIPGVIHKKSEIKCYGLNCEKHEISRKFGKT